MALLSTTTYEASEKSEIQEWTAQLAQFSNTAGPNDEFLTKLDTHLATRTTILGHKPCQADIELYKVLAPQVAAWDLEKRTGEQGYVNIVRYVDFVQNSKIFGLELEDNAKVAVDPDKVLYFKPPVDPRAEKERLRKEKATAAATQPSNSGAPNSADLVDRSVNQQNPKASKKEKIKNAGHAVVDKAMAAKEAVVGTAESKPKKGAKAPASVAPLSPALIDLRVGHILKAIKHPEADSLYVSTIAMGDKEGSEDTEVVEGQVTRTVCSGLNGLIPLADMQGRRVIVVANLKPVKMRGIKSCAMVLAASPRLAGGEVDNHAGPVELVAPPNGAVAGQRVFFEGWKGEPEGILNPKKKIWETIQPGFTTTDTLEVAFDASVVKDLPAHQEGSTPPGVGRLVDEAGNVCKVHSLRSAVVR